MPSFRIKLSDNASITFLLNDAGLELTLRRELKVDTMYKRLYIHPNELHAFIEGVERLKKLLVLK